MSNHEPGYRPMLVWAHTKIALQEIRQKLSDSHSCQERWLITAAAELVLSHPELHQEWINAALQLDGREKSFVDHLPKGPIPRPLEKVVSRARDIESALQGEVKVAANRVLELVKGEKKPALSICSEQSDQT
jgi:hypothetical protein